MSQSNMYDVYGLGNALVDIEFEISAEVLEQIGVEKGVMTLIDEEQQYLLVEKLQGNHRKRSCGGSAANTMIAISQFGGKAFYSCKVGPDETGQFYLNDLQACGVATNPHPLAQREGITGKCLVFVTPDADRTMNTFLGATATFSTDELDAEAIAQASYTYIEGYLVSSPTGQQAAVKARDLAKAAGQKVSLSLSDPNMVRFFKPQLLEIIGDGIDLIFANEYEALGLAETESFEEAIAYLKTLSSTFAVTRGSKGSVVYDGSQITEIAPTPVKAIDTVGAGDMYAGGVLYGITHGFSLAEGGALGSRASAELVMDLGPRMSTEKVQRILSEVLSQ
ncbi:MAG: adenosine kinase [Prochlorotrichaceae cyanobacterium]|jgi:sugar/nucleoside kinase (ribokinase family)